MKKNVLLLSEKMEDVDRINEVYSQDNSFHVKTVFSAKDAVCTLREDDTNLLVFNLKNFSSDKIRAALELRSLGISFPVLSLANKVDEQAYRDVSKLDSTVLLEKPFRNHEMLTISNKMSNGEDVVQRMHPRYSTNEKAYVSIYPRGDIYEVRLCDLSKGGARIELSDLIDFKVNDIVKLNVYLSSLKKNHSFTGRIHWISKSNRPGCNTLGLRYMSDIELFKSMLSA